MAVRCSAHRVGDGQPCGNWSITGGTVCRHHGGSAPQIRRKATEREAIRKAEEEAQRALVLFGRPRDIDPSQALLDLVHWTAGEVEFWRARVREVAEASGPDGITWTTTKTEVGQEKGQTTDLETQEAKPHIFYTMLYAAQDRLTQYATAALRAGVEERRIHLAEQQGDLVALAIRRILAALDLSPEQQSMITTIVPRELRAITAVAS